MRVLVLAPRFPEMSGKGDQVRSFVQVRDLAAHHDVTVVTAGTPRSAASARALGRLADVQRVAAGPVERGVTVVSGLSRARPGQVSWMFPRRAWRRASTLAASHDVVLAITIRAVHGHLSAPTVVDHVDALSLSMLRRARGPEAAHVRIAARIEGGMLRRWERRAATWVSAQMAIGAEDAAWLPQSPSVHVWLHDVAGPAFHDQAGHVRDIDVIFTGTMTYPPNAEAAQWLADEIAPSIRRAVPDASIVVAGRSASQLNLHDVTVLSDVPDLAHCLRRARIAIVPLRSGTGVPTKLIEAATNGAAVVATPWAADRFGIAVPQGASAGELTEQVVGLLLNEPARRSAVKSVRSLLEAQRHHNGANALEAVLLQATRHKGPDER